MNLTEIDNIIKSSKSILIISHVNPDGDTLGSMCSMYLGIEERFKKKADMVILSKLPKNYEFLPAVKFAKSLDELDKSREYDLVIAVDIASLDRTLGARILYDKAKFRINFDHHKTNSKYGEIALVEPFASSTGEVLYEFFRKTDWKITLDMATCLYAAILTDTGGFRFENTSSKSLKIASELVEIGANPLNIYKKCYESKSKNMVLFQAYCVSKATFLCDDKIVYTVVYRKDMEKFAAGDDYTDGIAEALRAIESTQVSFVVKQSDERSCKISMRSKKIDIAEICAKFGGGGHKFAAGCTIKGTPEHAVKALLGEINKQEV